MRRKTTLAMVSATLVGALALAVSGMVACPLSHDAYETNRPCWNELDCVQNELCAKPDAGELFQGQCGVPTDGPCGHLDGGAAGFYCFANEQGQPQSCFYEPNDQCVSCALDGGIPEEGCPDASCLQWRDRWGCQ